MSIETPSLYEPYKKLTLCSNLLVNVIVPFAIEERPVLLIGRGGLTPMVWLAAPTEPSLRIWRFIVDGNKVAHPAVEVQIKVSSRTVQVDIASQKALMVRANSIDEATVEHLDLRPVGLDIQGDENGMRLGGTTMSENHFENTHVAFALGGASKEVEK